MTECQLQLLQLIEEAFRGIELGDGVSLHQTIVIDNYGFNCDEAAELARHDERHDWRKLVDDPELLNVQGIGGLSFYDALGLRFHLPAYLSAMVKGYCVDDFGETEPDVYDPLGGIAGSLEFTLTHLDD